MGVVVCLIVRRFTVAQMTCAVVGTHLATLGVCVLAAAAILCLRHRPPHDLDLDLDPDPHLRHLTSTGSSYAAGNDAKKMAAAADMAASETVYLRLNGMHPYRCVGSYLSDTSTTGVSLTR